MQKLISKYGLAAHLALVAVAPLFLSPGAVLWVSALAMVWLVMEPSRIGDEMLHDARLRVASSLFRDPVFWVSLFLVVVAAIRALNTGITMAYDAETGKWALTTAVMPLIPGSVKGTGFPLVGCAVSAFVVMQGCRHALGRAARGAFLLTASLLSGVGAFVWAILFHDGFASAAAAVECPLTDPRFMGAAYGIYLVCAVLALMSAFENRWLKAMPLTLFGVSGNVLGLFMFAPAAVGVAYLAATLVVFLYAFVYLRLRMGGLTEFKYLVFLALGLVLGFLAAVWIFPETFVNERSAPYLAGAFVPEGYLESRTVLSGICARVWTASPWLGNGYGSFPLDLQFAALPAEWQVVTPLQKAMSNGYWMLLVERGVIGVFLLAVPLVLLTITYVRRLIAGVTLALPHPLSWAGLIVLLVAAFETLFDASFLLPGVLVALAAVFSLSATAFPKEKRFHG